jgi:hypothetical protein
MKPQVKPRFHRSPHAACIPGQLWVNNPNERLNARSVGAPTLHSVPTSRSEDVCPQATLAGFNCGFASRRPLLAGTRDRRRSVGLAAPPDHSQQPPGSGLEGPCPLRARSAGTQRLFAVASGLSDFGADLRKQLIVVGSGNPGIKLENRYGVTPIVGSNPTPSAMTRDISPACLETPVRDVLSQDTTPSA